MNAKEVCEFLGISRRTLMYRAADGELLPLPKAPGHKKAYRLVFDRSAVIEHAKKLSQSQQSQST